MCGIAGFVGGRSDRASAEQVRQMCQTIVHRGPDDEGIYACGPAGLGMRRLSVIDVSGGRQPIHNEDQKIWVVFNGEIYNFPQLRGELEQKGHKFYTQTDTEVIVHLYEDLGADCVKKLRGMFAIALYDERKQSLLLARDRLGKKPLYYAQDGSRLYFGSEIKAILAVAPHLAEVDPEGVLQFFYFDYIPDPYSAYRRIRKLPPGHLLQFENGSVRVEQYWDLPEYGTNEIDSEEECLDELERRLADAVRIRLISDVPLGAMLSGGVDSSIVVALMARASSSPVKTFSIGFENEDFSELQYSRIVAKRFGTDHHEMVVRPNVWETLQKLTCMMDEPFGDSSMVPTYHVSVMARQQVTVALAGDGGDELFAGYDRYAFQLERRSFDHIPEWVGAQFRRHVYPHWPLGLQGRKLSWNLSLQSRDRYLDGISFLPACHRERALFSRDFQESAVRLPDPFQQFREYYDHGPAKDPLSRLLYLDTKTYMTADVLAKVDRMSMAASLEVRAPILDHEFVEWVTALPASWKYRNGTRKYLLRKLAERLGIPREVLNRRKQGFALPLVHWMRQDMKGELRDILLDPRSLQRGYFNPNAVRAIVDEHISGKRNHPGVLWQMLVFELWHRNFLEKLPVAVLPLSWDAATEARPDQIPPSRAPVVEESNAAYQAVSQGTQLERLRVAIVAPSLRNIGGQSVQASLLLRGWRSESSVEAKFVPIDPEFPSWIGWMERVPFLRTVVRAPFYALRLWREMRDVDVVHIFSASYWSFWLAPVPAWAVARLQGKRTIVNYHSGEARSHLSKSRLARALLRRMGRKVVPSAYLRDVFREFSMKVDVIPNLVDVDQIRYRERTELRPILICTRGCEPYYAVDDVVRAFGLVQAVYPKAQLVLVGGGTGEAAIRKLVSDLQLQGVEFAGKVSRGQIGECYDRADIFINASVLDNMPVSVLEAFEAGLPVASTAPDGIRYLVEHERTGLLSPPRDWRQLGENVLRLLRDPNLARTLAGNARQQARGYRWEAVRQQWLRLYRAAVREESSDAETAAEQKSVAVEVK
ncbi:MAG TPA: asparagine synthase (glutamine-hydrolyzing) [Candidatus Sulfotelmatobacter sp.]|nr:asparagine synthase (glutamine-hydrolyzing) [Candidatus Sulfotelmatobacter sp.]